jgi:hypothetical protein
MVMVKRHRQNSALLGCTYACISVGRGQIEFMHVCIDFFHACSCVYVRRFNLCSCSLFVWLHLCMCMHVYVD